MSSSALSTSRSSCGVSVPRTSGRLTNALTMSETGALTFLTAPDEASAHCVRMDKESLPTGIEMPSAGQSSRPTACTVA